MDETFYNELCVVRQFKYCRCEQISVAGEIVGQKLVAVSLLCKSQSTVCCKFEIF